MSAKDNSKIFSESLLEIDLNKSINSDQAIISEFRVEDAQSMINLMAAKGTSTENRRFSK